MLSLTAKYRLRRILLTLQRIIYVPVEATKQLKELSLCDLQANVRLPRFLDRTDVSSVPLLRLAHLLRYKILITQTYTQTVLATRQCDAIGDMA